MALNDQGGSAFAAFARADECGDPDPRFDGQRQDPEGLAYPLLTDSSAKKDYVMAIIHRTTLADEPSRRLDLAHYRNVIAGSSPTVIISDMTAPLCESSQTQFGTQIPPGGGYINRASSVRSPKIQSTGENFRQTGTRFCQRRSREIERRDPAEPLVQTAIRLAGRSCSDIKDHRTGFDTCPDGMRPSRLT